MRLFAAFFALLLLALASGTHAVSAESGMQRLQAAGHASTSAAMSRMTSLSDEATRPASGDAAVEVAALPGLDDAQPDSDDRIETMPSGSLPPALRTAVRPHIGSRPEVRRPPWLAGLLRPPATPLG